MNIFQRSAYHAAKDLHGRMARTLMLTIALSMLAAIAVQQWTARDALRQVSAQSGLDHGRRIAAAIERLGPLPQRRDAVLQTYFDELQLQRLELIDASGAVTFKRQRPAASVDALSALDRVLRPGAQSVEVPLRPRSDGFDSGRLRIEPPVVDSRDLLWRSSLQFSAWLGLALLGVLAIVYWQLQPLRRQVSELGQRIADTQSPVEATGPPAPPPPTPEHRPRSTGSVKAMAEMKRLKADLSARSDELERLRREAYLDPLTGLPKRQQFMARLETALEGNAAWPASTVLLVRVRNLTGVNHRVGNDAANRVLKSLAKALQDTVDAEPAEGAMAGRLNGADFAVLLPYAGAAKRTAEALLEAVRRSWAEVDPEGGLSIAVADLQAPVGVKHAMALLDEALSRAEADVSYALAVAPQVPDQLAVGSSTWQLRLADALAKRSASLAEYPVCRPDGQLLHLDCPMRVQFDDSGALESAWRWLAPAARGRYCAELDLLALQMALDAIVADRQPRCINLSAQSLESSAFIASVTRELQDHPEAAKALWIDLPELMASDRPAIVREVSRQWRPFGTRLALEHAGERLGRIDHLELLGLDCIRIDGGYMRGLTGPESVNGRRHLQSIVRLVHEAGLSVTAEGVSTVGDLSMVWALGFDAATGPAVQLRRQSMSPQ